MRHSENGMLFFEEGTGLEKTQRGNGMIAEDIQFFGVENEEGGVKETKMHNVNK